MRCDIDFCGNNWIHYIDYSKRKRDGIQKGARGWPYASQTYFVFKHIKKEVLHWTYCWPQSECRYRSSIACLLDPPNEIEVKFESILWPPINIKQQNLPSVPPAYLFPIFCVYTAEVNSILFSSYRARLRPYRCCVSHFLAYNTAQRNRR